MLYDLVGILLIIGFSFLFKISITKGYDEQLIFILLALVVMVIYKYLTYRHMMYSKRVLKTSEPYSDFTTEVNDFLGQEIPNGINQGNINEYKSKLAALSEKVDIMNEYLKDLSTKASMDNQNNKAAIGGLDFQAGQQIQDYRIRKIQEDIQRTSDLIKQNRLAEDAKKYNKIKVFSSCVVAGADGGYSQDTPNASGGQAGTASSSSAPVPRTATSSSIPSTAFAAVGNSLDAGSGVDWASVIRAITTNGIDINIP
jgi:hypothetical protein